MILDKGYWNLARVAEFDGYDLFVWTDDEEQEPHFHIVKGHLENPEFDACVKLQSAEYFPHGGSHADRFTHDQLTAMVDLLNSSDIYFTNMSCWQVLIATWNRNNNHAQIDRNTPMPDYLQLAASERI